MHQLPLPNGDTFGFIKQKEWFRDKAYLDTAWVPTIWYWFTSVNGIPVKMWDTMSKEQADVYFPQKVAQYQNFKNYINVPLTPSQEKALTSFEYNLGSWIWNKNAMPIIEAINKWDTKTAGTFLKQYVNSWWKVTPWLVKRRNEEAQLLNA